MSFKSNPVKLNTTDYRIYKLWRNLIYAITVFLFIFFSYQLIFPTKYFTYSFVNSNSLKNTIHDVSLKNNALEFYASTPQEFSEINLEIELKNKNSKLENKTVKLQKSYRAFFFPVDLSTTNLDDISENSLISSGISVFIIGQNKKFPINNPVTFQNLGYNWDNIKNGKDIDLSSYKKQKLITINSTHPDGTILVTDKNNFYYIANGEKEKLQNAINSNKIKNPIAVNEESLAISDSCVLQKKILSGKKYYCTMSLKKIASFIGKDYRFKINNLDNPNLKSINLKFKKSVNKKNFGLFFSDLKKKLLTRFGYNSSPKSL